VCCKTSAFEYARSIKWDGDEVLFDTTIKAMRSIPDVRPRRRYAADIREFLAMDSNTVMHNALSVIARSLPADQRYRFFIKERGTFDFRALHVLHYVCEHVQYVQRGSRNYDTWLYPDETLALGKGDCEDMAFLIASLLMASGISPYMVRVALGYVKDKSAHAPGSSSRPLHQHAWVMYRSESGTWMLFDPMATKMPTSLTAGRARGAHTRVPSTSGQDGIQNHAAKLEYMPLFVFNSDHVWRVNHTLNDTSLGEYLRKNYRTSAAFWKKFNPSFNAQTHYNVFTKALIDTGLFTPAELFVINSASLAIDADIGTYHPYDHFDNGYIAEGWNRVDERLSSGNLIDFAHALHAVADFYAHSSYGHFFVNDKSIPLYTGSIDVPVSEANADSLNLDLFSCRSNASATPRPEQVKKYWRDKLIISGRYALPNDSMEGPFSFGRLTKYPSDLQQPAELTRRGWLPHHNEIAVDSSDMATTHKLYSHTTYKKEYAKRVDAAVRHSMMLAKEWKRRGE
jgi:hypothetical protein